MRTKKISELPVCPDEEIDNLKTIGVNAQNESYQVPMNKIKGSTGGLSDDIYTAIKDNVDTLWTKLNALIGDLANLAFSGTRTSPLTNNDKTPWPENESSDQTPTLTKPANNGGTILVGTASGGLITTSVEIKGIHLTQQLVISVSAGFSVSSATISAADANAGTTITVTYNSTSLNSANGSLLISSSEVSRTANLLVLAGGGTTQTFSVTQNLTGCTSSYSANMVTEGTTLTIVLTPNSGWTFTGGTISATMNNVAVAVTDGSNGTKVISFGAVSGDIVIMATAVEQSAPSQSIKLVQGKYIAYQGTSPSIPSTPSLYTEVCCMTTPISVDFTNLGDGVDWNNCSVEWVHNNIYERGNISFIRSGGFNPDSVKAGADVSSNSYSSSTIAAGTWAARQSSVTGIIATFKYNPTTGKVAEGCRVVLKNGDTILRTLISESDLQNATWE